MFPCEKYSRNSWIISRTMSQSTPDTITKAKSKLAQVQKIQEQQAEKLTFISQSNPVTGKMDWVVADREDYDYIQEIARSGYGDMLHDVDRNQKYYAAIRKAIEMMRARGQEVKVLDIGTGTGLLSMMSATAGADTVTACEAFMPMAKCAKQVIAANGFDDKIKLVPKRSDKVLLEEDLKERANLLVTELFDTELIGEGAIPSYTDAHKRLMQDDCMAVPTTGIMYIQAVQSTMLRQWNALHPIHMPGGKVISIPEEFTQCSGAPSLHDLQVDEVEGEITLISEPIEVFRFDFSRKDGLKTREDAVQSVKALLNGSVDAFVMWWDLEMEPTAQIILSCAPCWTRASGQPIPWRDHWMQAVYYPSTSKDVKKDEMFDIHCSHDEYSLWFDTSQTANNRPVCSCGLHVAISRNRLAQINDTSRSNALISVLQKHASPTKTCLVISDGSMLSLMAAQMGYKKVFVLDNNSATRRIMEKITKHNKLEDQISFIQEDVERLSESHFDGLKIDVVIAEPFFLGVHLPWQNLYFWYTMSTLQPYLSPSVVVLPESMTITGMAVQFRDLHKIRAPVGKCEGFDISHFDDLIEQSSETVDEEFEPHPLWEYPCQSLSDPTQIMSVNFNEPVETLKLSKQIRKLNCVRPGMLNGVALWTEFTFDTDVTLNCGLLQHPTNSSKKLSWDKGSKQGVHLFPRPREWNESSVLTLETSFNPANGDISFTFL